MIDQVSLIMGLATFGFSLIVGLLGWVAQNVVRTRLEEEYAVNYKERLQALENKHNALWKAAYAKQFLTQGFPMWLQFATESTGENRERARVFSRYRH